MRAELPAFSALIHLLHDVQSEKLKDFNVCNSIFDNQIQPTENYHSKEVPQILTYKASSTILNFKINIFYKCQLSAIFSVLLLRVPILAYNFHHIYANDNRLQPTGMICI